MGLVDKLLENIKTWVNLEVENFNDEETTSSRAVYRLAKAQHRQAIETHTQALEIATLNPTSEQAKAMEMEADKARIKAKKKEAKAKEKYDEFVQRHNAKSTSLCQQFESVFRSNGVKREHYHGGKFNGVNCIRIMEKAEIIVVGSANQDGMLQKCLNSKLESVSEESISDKMKKYGRLLSLLDAIWSSVRGCEAGILTTEHQIMQLKTALDKAKQLWMDLGITTLQPKWHLTFDGHLLEQVKRYQGLADKSEEVIEKFHQTLKTLRDRFRGISSYQQRETCIRRELRRQRSPEIQKHIDKYQFSIKQSSGTKRAADARERQATRKRAKQESRESTVAS